MKAWVKYFRGDDDPVKRQVRKVLAVLAAYAAALRQLRDQVTAQFVARAEMVEAVLTAPVAGEHVFVIVWRVPSLAATPLAA
jgi:hypothetical protein